MPRFLGIDDLAKVIPDRNKRRELENLLQNWKRTPGQDILALEKQLALWVTDNNDLAESCLDFRLHYHSFCHGILQNLEKLDFFQRVNYFSLIDVMDRNLLSSNEIANKLGL